VLFMFLVAGLVCASPCPLRGSSPQYALMQANSKGSERLGETQRGLAVFISDKLQGRKTFSGQPYDAKALVAAHPRYPMGTVLRVTNDANGRVVDVTVIDRSASGANRPIVDVSRAAAERLDFVRSGTVKVTTEVIKWGAVDQ
jgi:rare lipoprotein A